jgi:Protein of unknown function (DUF2934)
MKIDDPTRHQIRAHAYRIYLQRGRQPGHDMDDWLQAEYDLVQLPVHEFAQFHSFSAWASLLQ